MTKKTAQKSAQSPTEGNLERYLVTGKDAPSAYVLAKSQEAASEGWAKRFGREPKEGTATRITPKFPEKPAEPAME